MTPFGKKLELLRRRRGLQQAQLAAQCYINTSYLSSLENGRKGPPSESVIERIILSLDLDEEEAVELRSTIKPSKKTRKIPPQTSCEEYLLIEELWGRLGALTKNQVQLISLALKITQDEGGRGYREI